MIAKFLGIIVVCWATNAHAQNCQEYMNAKAAAAQAGDLSQLYYYDGLYHRCLNSRRAPAQVEIPKSFFDPPKAPTPRENALVGAFQRLEQLTMSGSKGLYGTESLSAAVNKQPNSPSPPPGYQDKWINGLSTNPAPQATPPGYNPFSRRPETEFGQQKATLRPPAGYNDPFAGKSLPQPGELGTNNNCTFAGCAGNSGYK